ncbi:MAG: hypothetical protein M1522_02340 [Actinobacteria bacterium]|nr:hypothetical protein [Actinomycetota bacterium]
MGTAGESASAPSAFVVGLDLDGTCADFYARMRMIAAEWLGVAPDCLTEAPDWDLRSRGIGADLYVEDSPAQIAALRAIGKDVLVISSSVKVGVEVEPDERVSNWSQAEAVITERHRRWRSGSEREHSCDEPEEDSRS